MAEFFRKEVSSSQWHLPFFILALVFSAWTLAAVPGQDSDFDGFDDNQDPFPNDSTLPVIIPELVNTIDGSSAAAGFGKTLFTGKDINSDGVNDFIVSSLDIGLVEVYSGIDQSLLYQFQEAAGSMFGYQAKFIQDVNVDNTPDILVSAPGDGSSFIKIFSGIDGSLLHIINGATTTSQFGHSVTVIPDQDSDGIEDFATADVIEVSAGEFAHSVKLISSVTANTLQEFTNTDSVSASYFAMPILDWTLQLGFDANSDSARDLFLASKQEDAGPTIVEARVAISFADAAGFLVASANTSDYKSVSDKFLSEGIYETSSSDYRALFYGVALEANGANDDALVRMHRNIDSPFSYSASQSFWYLFGPGPVRRKGFSDYSRVDDLIVGTGTSPLIGYANDSRDNNTGAVEIRTGIGGKHYIYWKGENADDQFGYAIRSLGDIGGTSMPEVLVSAPGYDNGADADAGRLYLYTFALDSDGDGIKDSLDSTPLGQPASDIDNDGYPDSSDALPNDPNEWSDTDGDGVGDNADLYPNNPLENADTDGDGVGDNADVFPNDATETVDSDSDGVGDNSDVFPSDGGEWLDSDGDGIGDNSDAFPLDASETQDTDGDGVGDNADVFPSDASESVDSDGDGTGDNSDAFPSDQAEDSDRDGDGVGDNADVYPDNPAASKLKTSDGGGSLPLGVLVLLGLLMLGRVRASSRDSS